MKNILILASTVPASSNDPVPAFVAEQATWFKKMNPELSITILAPHNFYSNTKKFTKHKYYDEYRFHYFWPSAWEKLAGRGIAPALKSNPLLYFQIPFLFIFEFLALWRLTKKLHPDLIYAHWFTPQAITAAAVSKITNVPFIYTTHASDVAVLRGIPFSKKIVAAVCIRASAYTAVSRQTADKLLAFTTKENCESIKNKLSIIPMGTTTVDAPSKAIINNVEKAYGLTDSKRVLFIGRLVSRKGVHYLVNAFSEIINQGVSMQLIIAGDGPERVNLEKECARLGLGKKHVVFTGYIMGKKKAALINSADILCIPSINEGGHAEGLPVVFMEGLAAGKIVIASDVSGAQEYIEPAKNGYLFRQRDTADLTKVLRKVLSLSENKAQEISSSAKEFGRLFEWQEIVKRHYDLFVTVLDSKYK
jgi:glycosyltransferase involved in cell wall biosynthesis